jgi:hypothetical protein
MIQVALQQTLAGSFSLVIRCFVFNVIEFKILPHLLVKLYGL